MTLDKICPICGSNSFKNRYHINSYDIFICQNCTGGFTHPRPTFKEFPEIYGDGYFQEYLNTPSHSQAYAKWRYTQIMRLLRSTNLLEGQDSPSVFDIGCGTGFLLSVFKSKGWETSGIDVSFQLAEYAIRHFGLDIVVGNFIEAGLVHRKFDLVTMVHVIEHFTDPGEAIVKAGEFLRPGGLIFIETPNWNGIGSVLSKGQWSHLIPPEHLTYFGPRSMRIFVDRNGFSVQRISTVTPPYLEAVERYPAAIRQLAKLVYRSSSLMGIGPTLQILVRPNNYVEKTYTMAK